MNFAPTIDRPTTPSGTAESLPYIMATLRLADFGMMSPLYTPAGNRIGAVVLGELLKAMMEAADVRVLYGGGSGELNDSFFTFQVSAIKPALPVFKEVFAKFGLLDHAQIMWFDEYEGIVRLVHPHTNIMELPFEKLFAEIDFVRFLTDLKTIRALVAAKTDSAATATTAAPEKVTRSRAPYRVIGYALFVTIMAAVAVGLSFVHWSLSLCVALYAFVFLATEFRKGRRK